MRRDFLRQRTGESTDRIAVLLKETLAAKGIRATVSGREKRPYSIWSKMQRKAISFEQLSDIFGFRVIVDTVDDCYHALGHHSSGMAGYAGTFQGLYIDAKA